MGLTIGDVMTRDVQTLDPEMTLTEMDRVLVSRQLSGAPVVEDGCLVGIVSRADVIRILYDEQVRAQQVSDFYKSPFPIPMATTRSPVMATSARTRGAPVPSITSPPSISRSHSTRLFDDAMLLGDLDTFLLQDLASQAKRLDPGGYAAIDRDLYEGFADFLERAAVFERATEVDLELMGPIESRQHAEVVEAALLA